METSRKINRDLRAPRWCCFGASPPSHTLQGSCPPPITPSCPRLGYLQCPKATLLQTLISSSSYSPLLKTSLPFPSLSWKLHYFFHIPSSFLPAWLQTLFPFPKASVFYLWGRIRGEHKPSCGNIDALLPPPSHPSLDNLSCLPTSLPLLPVTLGHASTPTAPMWQLLSAPGYLAGRWHPWVADGTHRNMH